MKAIMRMMMPRMVKTMRNMSFEEKLEMIDEMMPQIMSDMSFDEKMQIMQSMMPKMLDEMKSDQIDRMVDTMMPIMLKNMEAKGIDIVKIIHDMYPKCIQAVTDDAREKTKSAIKGNIQKVSEKI